MKTNYKPGAAVGIETDTRWKHLIQIELKEVAPVKFRKKISWNSWRSSELVEQTFWNMFLALGGPTMNSSKNKTNKTKQKIIQD